MSGIGIGKVTPVPALGRLRQKVQELKGSGTSLKSAEARGDTISKNTNSMKELCGIRRGERDNGDTQSLKKKEVEAIPALTVLFLISSLILWL